VIKKRGVEFVHRKMQVSLGHKRHHSCRQYQQENERDKKPGFKPDKISHDGQGSYAGIKIREKT
jgi:hypothetical protein